MTPQQEQPPRTPLLVDEPDDAIWALAAGLTARHISETKWCRESHLGEAQQLAAFLHERGYTLAATPSPSSEPHENSEQAEVAAKVLGSQWHDHKIETETQRFIWRHRHEAATPSPSSGLDAAWSAVEAVLPKSKGRWGYSIGGLTYGTRGWCAVAQGERPEEHAEAYGATPADALRSLAARLQEQER